MKWSASSCVDVIMLRRCETNKYRKSRETRQIEPTADHDIVVETIPDETSIKRINKALEWAKIKATSSKWDKLLFGDAIPRFMPEEFVSKSPQAVSLLSTLNESQRRAASLVARARDVAIIHGRK